MGEVGHVIALPRRHGGRVLDRAGRALPAAPVRIGAGEMVIFPGGDANIMASDPGMRGTPDWDAYYRTRRRTPAPVDHGQRRTRMRVPSAAGSCAATSSATPARSTRCWRAADDGQAPVSAESWQWVARLLDAAVEASGQDTAGREAMLAKLAELMFVEALRGHIATLPPDARSWVAGLKDPQVGAALRLIHARTGATRGRSSGWRVRSPCPGRRSPSGSPPTCRCRRCSTSRGGGSSAPRACSRRAVTASQAAAAVGYQSEAAFHRAFKRLVGVPPGAWRRGRRHSRLTRSQGIRKPEQAIRMCTIRSSLTL